MYNKNQAFMDRYIYRTRPMDPSGYSLVPPPQKSPPFDFPSRLMCFLPPPAAPRNPKVGQLGWGTFSLLSMLSHDFQALLWRTNAPLHDRLHGWHLAEVWWLLWRFGQCFKMGADLQIQVAISNISSGFVLDKRVLSLFV